MKLLIGLGLLVALVGCQAAGVEESRMSWTEQTGDPPTRQAADVEPADAEAASITFQISGAKPGAGPVRLAIFDADTGFPNAEQATVTLTTEEQKVSHSLTTPLKGSAIAVAAYQDLNGDGQLNRSSFGMPTEPYGFSNDAKGQMGPPAFGDAAIAYEPGMTIDISL